jgi:hypothetical protein
MRRHDNGMWRVEFISWIKAGKIRPNRMHEALEAAVRRSADARGAYENN